MLARFSLEDLLRSLRFVLAVVLFFAAGCKGGDPPGDGVLLLGVAFQPTAGSVIEGIRAVDVTTKRVDVVYRSVAADPSTEQVLTISNEQRTFTLAGFDSPTPVLIGEFTVRPGFIFEIRLITADDLSIVMKFATTTSPAKLPSGPQTGLKAASETGASFPIIGNQTTAVELLFDPMTQVIRNNGQGFIIHPTIPAIQVDPSILRQFFPGEYVVGFKAGTSVSDMQKIHGGIGATVIKSLSDIRCDLVKVPPTTLDSDVFKYYIGQDAVLYALPNFPLFPQSTPNDIGLNATDYLFGGKTDASTAWDLFPSPQRPGSPLVRMAIADTGVDLVHPDLMNNIYINQAEMKGFLASAGLPMPVDLNSDGVITFAELNDSTNATNKKICDSLRHQGDSQGGDPSLCDPLDLVNGQPTSCALCMNGNPPTNCNAGYGWQNGCDDDCDGLCDDLVGWDFSKNTNLPFDIAGHGTAVAGIAGMVGDNMIDSAGMAWDVGIIPYKVTDDSGAASLFAITQFIDAAKLVDGRGIDIANISLDVFQPVQGGNTQADCHSDSTPFLSPLARDKFDAGVKMAQDHWRSLGADNILFTVAAGNCAWDLDRVDVFVYPALLRRNLNLTNMLVVTSMNSDGELRITSTHPGTILPDPVGVDTIDVIANGDRVFILKPGGGFDNKCGPTGGPCAGTSFAAPMVAGTAALVLSRHPELTGHADQIADRISSTAQPSSVPPLLPDYPSFANVVRSGGRLSAVGAAQ